MSRIVASILLLAAAVLSSCARQNVRVTAADGPCEIEGTVIYEDGRPANHATVSAFPTDRGLVAKVPSADTDELGHFHIKHLWLGKFAVTAKKRGRRLS
jgi:Carboxypeptidase regulatory-like domain